MYIVIKSLSNYWKYIFELKKVSISILAVCYNATLTDWKTDHSEQLLEFLTKTLHSHLTAIVIMQRSVVRLKCLFKRRLPTWESFTIDIFYQS